METDQRRVVYTVVAINTALAILLGFTSAIQWSARSSMPTLRNPAFTVGFALDLLLLAVLVAGIWLELRRRLGAVWLNMGWPLASLICAPILMFAEAMGDPHRQLVMNAAIGSSVAFAVILLLYGALYKVAFSSRIPEDVDLEALGRRSRRVNQVSFWSALALTIYPIAAWFAFASGLLSKRSEASLNLLLFLACPSSIVALVLSLRTNGTKRVCAVTLSVLALVLNLLLLILAGFAA